MGAAMLTLAACAAPTPAPPTSTAMPAVVPTAAAAQSTPTPNPMLQIDALRARYGSYTLERAAQEGFVRDEFCLDAASLNLPPSRGAMGFHATDEARLRGPIDPERPQALMFDAEGRVLGIEYEIMVDAVPAPPLLFGRTFGKLPAHPGVDHEHYALHVWFVENPGGQFDDFNPRISCPPGSTPPSPGSTAAAGSLTRATFLYAAERHEHDEDAIAQRVRSSIPGVIEASASTSGIAVEFDPARTSADEIRSRIEGLGFRLQQPGQPVPGDHAGH
jgi:hypothetical protein